MMNTLFHEMVPTNDFQFNCRSRSENHFTRYNKIHNKSTASSKLEPTNNQESSSSSSGKNDVDYSAALKLISDLLMEDEDDKACVVHDSLALQAIEKSFYDALHNNTNLDQNQNPLVFNNDPFMDDFFDFQFLGSSNSVDAQSERYFDPFHLNNNCDYDDADSSEQNNYMKTTAKRVRKKRNVAESTLDDHKVMFCIKPDHVMQINGVSQEQSQGRSHPKGWGGLQPRFNL